MFSLHNGASSATPYGHPRSDQVLHWLSISPTGWASVRPVFAALSRRPVRRG
ncbi:MAG: hypothetical protein WCA46_24920 [Actinocatenispora sp.]